jgi:VanZ family protein
LFPAADKVAHVCLYAVLGAALAWGGRRTWKRSPHVLLLLLGSLYGASDEWHQSFVPGRDSSPWDWAADNVGVLLGYVLFLLIVSRIAKRYGTDRDTTTTNRDTT